MCPTDKHIIYSTAFAVAEREICVFSGPRDMEYSGDFISASIAFLADPSHRLRVACQCVEITNCPIIKAIMAAPLAGDLTVYDASRYHGKAPYFMTLDGSGYRLESADKTLVNYGDIATTQHLRKQYERIAAGSQILIQHEALVVQ